MENNRDVFRPVHPGEILKEEFLVPLDISQNKLALSMRVPPQMISDIVNEKRSITAETALRLASVIGTTPQFWMSLQMNYDLKTKMNEKGEEINRQVEPIQVCFENA